MARQRGSKTYAVGRGKRRLLSRSASSTRTTVTGLRAWGGAHKRGDQPNFRQAQRSTRRKGRRKKVTIVERVFRWIRVPTNLITRRR